MQIIWKHNGVEIHEDDAKKKLMNQRETLLIENMEGELTGTYRCEASNKAGSTSRDYVLRMTGKGNFEDLDNFTLELVRKSLPKSDIPRRLNFCELCCRKDEIILGNNSNPIV